MSPLQPDHHVDCIWPLAAELGARLGEGILAGMTVIETDGLRRESGDNRALYRYDTVPAPLRPQRLRFIPCFAWANRGEGEMRVWVHEA